MLNFAETHLPLGADLFDALLEMELRDQQPRPDGGPLYQHTLMRIWPLGSSDDERRPNQLFVGFHLDRATYEAMLQSKSDQEWNTAADHIYTILFDHLAAYLRLYRHRGSFHCGYQVYGVEQWMMAVSCESIAD